MAGVACVEGGPAAALLQRHRGGVAPAHATQAQQKCESFMSIAASKASTAQSTAHVSLGGAHLAASRSAVPTGPMKLLRVLT